MAPTKPFHVEGVEPMKMKMMGVNMMPAMIKVMGLLPDRTRKNMMTKQNAPTKDSIPYDRFDCLGTSPYETVEVLPNKIWRVSYAMEDRSMTEAKEKKKAASFGMDWSTEDVKEKVLAGAATEGEKTVESAKKDLEKILTLWNKNEWTMEERFSIPPHTVNMLVVKLNSGSLLLYAPTRVRDETGFGAWLDALGKVEWLVVASSFHTLSLPSVLARYPDAKVIGAPQSQDKLNYAGALARGKFDYISTNEEDMVNVNGLLDQEGVKLFNVAGDVGTNALLAVAHGVMLSCDLIYGRPDGGIFGLSKKELDENKEEHAGIRLFKYVNCNKPNSPNGYLAKYRFMFMDHTGFSAMMYEPAAKDGSTCTMMANSLRSILKEDFDTAEGPHITTLSRDDYRNFIDCNWNWLDGKTLL